MSELLTVSLKSMRFSAMVGILPHEITAAQPIEVDISVVSAPASLALLPDKGIGVSVDYRDLYAIAEACITGRHSRLLEDVAREISRRVLALTGVVSCIVAVRKTQVTLPGPLDYSEVRIESARDG